QSVFGLRAMTTGLIMFPAALASGLMMPLSGKMFDRYGPRGVVLTGLAVVVWTTYMMADFNQMTPYLVMSAWLALRGIGMGLSFMPVNTAGMNTVPLRLVGRASALSNVVRQVASSLGVAMFTSIMQHRHAFHLANLAASAKLDNSQGEALASALQGIATASGMGAAAVPLLGGNILYSMAVREAMVNAIADCFIVSAALCTVALVLALRLKRSAPHLEPASLPAAAVEA
ncbi:MAG: MFS transporter, partial [Syntrophomonadaceae bacterium]|nr:MFS transporter [Syntrophomonadaceae bacterium]